MKKFISIMMATGLIDKPYLRHYWSTNSVMYTPYFRKMMTRDRFFAILAFFHLTNNEDQAPQGSPNYDKLFKIRPLYDHLRHTFSTAYYPDENVAIDESIMPWRGRVSFRQFIPKKPIRYGMKLYCICESCSGYIVNFKFYSGAEAGNPKGGHGPNVVKELMAPYLGKGHTVFTDSFFTTVPLYEYLQVYDTKGCGTVVRNRRDNPPDISARDCKLRKGEHVTRQRNNVVAVRYNDRKDFMLISTKFTGKRIDTGKTTRQTNEPIRKPEAVHHYNQHMNGVDLFDQNMTYYSFSRKTMKWWKRAATHFIHLAKVQSFILYKKKSTKTLTQIDFTLKLIDQLACPQPTDPQPPDPQPADPQPSEPQPADPQPLGNPEHPVPNVADRLSHANSSHWLESIPTNGKKLHPTKNCFVCTMYSGRRKGYIRRKETRYQCANCKVPLCVEPCNKLYHTVKDYAREIRRYYRLE